MTRLVRFLVLAAVALGTAAAASPAAAGVVASDPPTASSATCIGPCAMFLVGKGNASGKLQIWDDMGQQEDCVLTPLSQCARMIQFNEAGTTVARFTAVPTPPYAFGGWEGCPKTDSVGTTCLVAINDYVNTEYLCAIFKSSPATPNPAPGCPPTASEPPPPPPDTTAPNTRITASPRRTTTSRRASFRFTASEAGSRFICKLDARPWYPCRSPKSYARLKRAIHTFRVRAIDLSGNMDATPAVRRWRIS